MTSTIWTGTGGMFSELASWHRTDPILLQFAVASWICSRQPKHNHRYRAPRQVSHPLLSIDFLSRVLIQSANSSCPNMDSPSLAKAMMTDTFARARKTCHPDTSSTRHTTLHMGRTDILIDDSIELPTALQDTRLCAPLNLGFAYAGTTKTISLGYILGSTIPNTHIKSVSLVNRVDIRVSENLIQSVECLFSRRDSGTLDQEAGPNPNRPKTIAAR
ncbi:hypothetical protein AG1IA_05787 [Rhizoctonia solani AG-1 IA]|uniref:Uncharacterized protein n=1 Tax=Thanatephorus cucumeris (strain AG1-IA) TaxID=983506 RepID=L8WQA6_THACA|nr:hypothetical protein AG1IA_05787 [Rhizoctonia solani AG-1 IA]